MTRTALKVVTSANPERANLAAAIAAHADADRVYRSNQTAAEKAEESLFGSYAPEAEAERALQVAKAEEPGRIAAEFRGDDITPGLTVEQAEVALSLIRAKRVAIRSARNCLEKETSNASHRASWKLDAVKAAAAAVVQESPELSALIQARIETERRLLSIRGAFDVIERAGALPRRARLPLQPDPSVAIAWAAAIDALLIDADAPLPAVE